MVSDSGAPWTAACQASLSFTNGALVPGPYSYPAHPSVTAMTSLISFEQFPK